MMERLSMRGEKQEMSGRVVQETGKERAQQRARETLLYRIEQGSLKRIFRTLGFLLVVDGSGCASIQVREPESVQGARLFSRIEIDHPTVEIMRQDLGRFIGPERVGELLPPVSERSVFEARTQAERLRQSEGQSIRGWEFVGINPQTAYQYFSLGFPAAYFRPDIASAEWVQDRIVSAYFSNKNADGSCTISLGDTPSFIRLSSQWAARDSVVAVSDMLDLVSHEYAHARDPRNAPYFVPLEPRLVVWWQLSQLLQDPDHPQSSYVNRITHADSHQQNFDRLVESFAEYEMMVYATENAGSESQESWEFSKARSIAEQYDCSPAAALRIIRLSQYWAMQFQPQDEADVFDWQGAERMRAAYEREMVRERGFTVIHALVAQIPDVFLRHELEEQLRIGFDAMRPAHDERFSVSITIPRSIRRAVRARDSARQAVRAASELLQREGEVVFTIQEALDRARGRLETLQYLWSHLSLEEQEQTHRIEAEFERSWRVIQHD